MPDEVRGLQCRCKLAALALAVAVVGLPVNRPFIFALLVLADLLVFSGEVSTRGRNWIAAVAVVLLGIAAQWVLAPPRIDEGHNVFRPGGPGVLERGLPADVYNHLAAEFAARYPRPDTRDGGFPDRVFAFSADGIFHKSDMSRAARSIDFSDPVWLRLGFINENRYNWYGDGELKRAERDRRSWKIWRRWHLLMPWFEAVKLPAAYAGGELCWRGDVMWEGDGGHFTTLPPSGCRAITPADAGRRVFGSGITPDTLAMHLKPPAGVQVRLWAMDAVVLAAIIAIVALLAPMYPLQRRRLVVPALLLVLATIVIVVDDSSLLGGVRPFDGGDDGLVYDDFGRTILQHLLSGDIFGALQSPEKVFYYGGPGLRYFRAIEHILFGESYLGYAALLLVFPIAVFALFRRFLADRWALGLALVFVAIPVGVFFGTTYFQYVKFAARGYADPAAYIFFICGIVPLLGATDAAGRRTFASGFFGALFIALGICMKPIVAPAAAVLLGGAGFVALYHRQWLRLSGLCIGFIPVILMPLHNWIYGHVFVLFSANSADANLLVMPPFAYVAAARELLTLHFGGEHIVRAMMQIVNWLRGPAESYLTVPLNAAGIVILVYVVVRGRTFDPWLRLVGAAALVQHVVAFFYIATSRYHYLSWFLTMLVVMVWVREAAIGWISARYPQFCERMAARPAAVRLASGLTWLQK